MKTFFQKKIHFFHIHISVKLDNDWPGCEWTQILGTSGIPKMGSCHCARLCHNAGLPRLLRFVCSKSKSSRLDRLPNDTTRWSFRGENKHVSQKFCLPFYVQVETNPPVFREDMDQKFQLYHRVGCRFLLCFAPAKDDTGPGDIHDILKSMEQKYGRYKNVDSTNKETLYSKIYLLFLIFIFCDRLHFYWFYAKYII
jgi:hypothetical protein